MVPPASCRGGFTVAVDLQSAAVSCCNGFVYRPLRGYRHQVLLARRHTVLLRSHVVHQRDQCLQRLGRLEVGQGDNCVHLLLRRAHRGLHRLRQASLVRAGLVELRRQRAEGALDAPDESLHAAEGLGSLVHVQQFVSEFFSLRDCGTEHFFQIFGIFREDLKGLDIPVNLECYRSRRTARHGAFTYLFVYLLNIP